MSVEANIIYCGDNLDVLKKYIPEDSIDLIYIDPPFNSSRNYEVFWGEAQERRAFEDRFGDVMHYLEWMRPRLRELHRVLKSTGTFYYHCDWHASHYIKVELDRIFNIDNFRNEIVWWYETGGIPRNDFSRKHDIIFRYVKGEKWIFNAHDVMEPRSDEVLRRIATGIQGATRSTGQVRHPSDVFKIPSINAMAAERLGYPTQKPLLLLEKIVRASSNEGDIVLDAFCGCGTTLEAAAKWKRNWIGVDFSPTACRVMATRLESRLGLKPDIDFTLKDMPKTTEQLRKMPHFEFQNWACVALGGIPNKVKVGDYGIDGRLYLADITKEQKEVTEGQGIFETLDKWYPIQVKQMDKVGRPDIDKFETAMRRDKRVKGYFIAFDFSSDAIKEIKRAQKDDGLDISPITVDELLQYEKTALP